MKNLRLLRNIAVLFILVMALLSWWSGAQPLRARNTGYTCYFDSSTVGYNCTFNADLTCTSVKCQAGRPCNNGVCPKSCGFGNKPGHNCYIDASNQCRETPCKRGELCLNSGCI